MPYLLSTAFDQFIERITIGGDLRATAKARRDKIAELLEGTIETLDIFPTGSLVRGTGLKGSSDIDMIAVLHFSKHIKGKTCIELLEDIRDVVSAYNAQIVRKNGQAVTLYFRTWPNVDLVPAKRVNLHDGGHEIQIPDANTNEWIVTNPGAHDAAIKELPLRTRQLIRMAKCWNVAHSSYMRSFHIELAALETGYTIIDGDYWAEDDWPYSLVEYFEKALEITPTTRKICFEYDMDDWLELQSRLRRAKDLAYEAWRAACNDDNATAMAKLRVLFGDRFPAYGD